MSIKDKTRAKLVGSMRRNKSAAGLETPAQSEPVAESKSPAPVVSSKKESKAMKNKEKSKSPAATSGYSTGAYQSGGRVWPD